MDVFLPSCIFYLSVASVFAHAQAVGAHYEFTFSWKFLDYLRIPSLILAVLDPNSGSLAGWGFLHTTFRDLVSILILVGAFRSGFRQHCRGVCIYIDSSHSKDNFNTSKQCPSTSFHGFPCGQDPTMDFHHWLSSMDSQHRYSETIRFWDLFLDWPSFYLDLDYYPYGLPSLGSQKFKPLDVLSFDIPSVAFIRFRCVSRTNQLDQISFRRLVHMNLIACRKTGTSDLSMGYRRLLCAALTQSRVIGSVAHTNIKTSKQHYERASEIDALQAYPWLELDISTQDPSPSDLEERHIIHPNWSPNTPEDYLNLAVFCHISPDLSTFDSFLHGFKSRIADLIIIQLL